MSSDLYVLDNFFADSFSPFCDDSSIDILQANNQNPVDESCSIDQFGHNYLLSCSPPSNLLENLSLYQSTNHLQQHQPPLAANGYQDFTCLESMEVKSEDSLVGFDILSSSCNNHIQQEPLVVPQSYSGVENGTKYMQRSYSSNCFDGNTRPGFLFQPRFDSLFESPNFYNQALLSSPENSFFAGQMRRACSTGDLQNTRTPDKGQRSISSPLARQSSFMEETNFKVGRYSTEERKERISKYRAKRNRRNFNKTIKYACRKTLADNRPRIRGRFARNDEAGEIPKAASSVRDDDEYDLWLDGLQEEEEEDGTMKRGGPFVGSFGQHQQHQLQYYGFY